MEPFAKRPRVEGPGAEAVPAESVITFHLLKKDARGQVVMEEDAHFPPDMTHQLFGEDEVIVGYDGLSIDVWLTPQFQAFIDVKHAGRGAGATELREPFAQAFEAGFFEDKAAFDAALQEEAPLDVAALGAEVGGGQPTEEGTTFRVFKAQLSTADPQLKALHARLQPLLYFFVDASSAIDAEDPGWHLLTAVETAPDGEVQVLGFATCYRCYHYPDGARLRLGQILVLPPHQGRGAGGMLLGAAAALADELDACDLAFEDPAEALQALRTRLDASRALALDWVQPVVQERLAALAADKGKGGAANGGAANGAAARAARAAAAQHPLAAPPAVLARLRRELRLSKLQAGVVWRVLLFVVGKGEPAVVAGLGSLIRAGILAEVAGAKGDAQGKSVRETEKGFVMCRGASEAAGKGGLIPTLPVEEQTAEQQAEAVEEAAEAALQAAAAVAAKFLGGAGGLAAVEEGEEEEEESGEEEGA